LSYGATLRFYILRCRWRSIAVWQHPGGFGKGISRLSPSSHWNVEGHQGWKL